MDDQKVFPIEEVARQPLPGMAAPGEFAFSPDDRLLTFLWSPERTLTRELDQLDLETGERGVLVAPARGTTEEEISLEEALRRERQRQLALGVTSYAWATRASRLLIPLRGGVYVQDGPGAPLRCVVGPGPAPALDPALSPEGRWVAFVREGELFVVDAAGGEPRQLTLGGRENGRTRGLAEFVAQEEMGRSRGFWWSRDGKRLAFVEVDEEHLPVYRIVHQGKDEVGPGAQEDHRYPFAGAANARVRLGVVSIEGGEPIWLDLGPEPDVYLARVDWLPDGRLVAQVENRAQTALDLVRFDLASGQRETILRETSDVWINLHDLFRPLDDGRFIWASERTGFRHLYLHGPDGALIRPLTSGDWLVETIAGLDEERGFVYFTGTREGPLETHLYAVSLDGGEPRRITREAGIHAVVLDHANRRFVDAFHNLHRPPTSTVRSLDGGEAPRVVDDAIDPRIAELGLQPPELVTLTTRDGETLHGAIYHPPVGFGPGPHPTIVSVYGGPHAQLVANSWRMTVAMRAQYLRRLGFLVFTLDNRGSARRGLAFEEKVKNNLGDLEVRDQVDGVRWLIERGLADPERVGIYGWSYGGYMAVRCLLRAPEVFKVAVAGAPVTHWDGYDTHYTERYMGTPESNPEGYAASSVMAHVGNLRGKLLLVHGLIDENVHFRHTARLINALIAARKPYDLLLFPDERHLPRRLEDRVYMEERIREYFLQNL
jgi:dipeptidyl-peptidase-4